MAISIETERTFDQNLLGEGGGVLGLAGEGGGELKNMPVSKKPLNTPVALRNE